MKHYEYAYEPVPYNARAAVLAVAEEHREIIARRAAEGWRYVGLIPTEVSANGCPRKADLVFERET